MNDQNAPMLQGFNTPDLMAKPIHEITQMTRKASKGSGSPSWVCNCKNGDVIWIFLHKNAERNTYPLYAAYHAEMDAMKLHETIFWTSHPIQVIARMDGDYWRTIQVMPRAEGSLPDAPTLPESPFARDDGDTEETAMERNQRLVTDWARAASASVLMHRPAALMIDFETNDRHLSSIPLSVAIIDVLEGDVIFKSFIRPTVAGFKNHAEHINKLSNSQLADAPTFADLYPQLEDALSGKLVCAYNADFDLAVLRFACLRAGMMPIATLPPVCVMKLFAAYRGIWDEKRKDWKWATLADAAALFGIRQSDAHTALDDCRVAKSVLEAMAVDTPLLPEFPF